VVCDKKRIRRFAEFRNSIGSHLLPFELFLIHDSPEAGDQVAEETLEAYEPESLASFVKLCERSQSPLERLDVRRERG